MRVVALVTAVLLAAGSAVGLSYVECSSGFQNNPALEGGRTELEFADIDNDGNVDILCIGDHGSPYINTQEHGVMVWFGNGQGNWSVFQYGDFGYGGIAIGDVNGDGKWDIGYGMHHNYASGDLGDQLMEVALGDGTGQMWTAWDDSLAQEGQNWGMFATDFADIDNDGDLDVGAISFGADDGIHVYLNLGNGAWRRSFGFAGGNSQMEFYFRDVNRDGNADMIASHGTGTVWLGDGTGNFAPANTGLPSSSYGMGGVSVGDVDNDGGCDVALVTETDNVQVYVWNEYSFAWEDFSGSLPSSDSFYSTQLCDMNADGFVDLLGLRRGYVQVWTGDGAGNWTPAAQIPLARPNGYSAFRAGADFDHNGYPDLAMVTREGTWPSDHNVAHALKESSDTDSLRIFPVFPRGREKLMDGSVQFIDWWCAAPGAESTRVKLELSAAGRSGPWELVADSLQNAGRHQWLVPDSIVSGDCYIRYTAYGPGGSVEAMTPYAFVIGDTVLGVAESHRPQAARRTLEASIVRGVLVLGAVDSRRQTAYRAQLLDVSGRKALELHTGANDVSKLSPGVYFVATSPPLSSPPEGERVGVRGRQASGVMRDALRVTKVVLQR